MFQGYVRPASHRLNRCFFERCYSLRLRISLAYYSDAPVSVRELQGEEETINDILYFMVGEGYVKSYNHNGRACFRPGIALPPVELFDLTRAEQSATMGYASERNAVLAS